MAIYIAPQGHKRHRGLNNYMNNIVSSLMLKHRIKNPRKYAYNTIGRYTQRQTKYSSNNKYNKNNYFDCYLVYANVLFIKGGTDIRYGIISVPIRYRVVVSNTGTNHRQY